MIPELRIKEDNEVLCVFCKRCREEKLLDVYNLDTGCRGVAHNHCMEEDFWSHNWIYRGFENGRL